MTRLGFVRRVVTWALAGVILSPLVGAPLWTLTGEDRASDALPLATAAAGLVAGLLALRYLPAETARRAPTAFSVAYPTMHAWWLGWAGGVAGFVVLAGVLAVSATSIAVLRTVPARVARELRKAAAALVWVMALLAMPLFLFGLVFVPMAISLTIVARTSRDRAMSDQTDEPGWVDAGPKR